MYLLCMLPGNTLLVKVLVKVLAMKGILLQLKHMAVELVASKLQLKWYCALSLRPYGSCALCGNLRLTKGCLWFLSFR